MTDTGEECSQMCEGADFPVHVFAAKLVCKEAGGLR